MILFTLGVNFTNKEIVKLVKFQDQRRHPTAASAVTVYAASTIIVQH